MNIWKKGCLVASICVISACRLEITATTGGAVVSDSGQNDCGTGSTCIIEISDTNFQDTFSAVPGEGKQFIGWKKGPMMLCGWSMEPCTLTTSGFADSEQLMSILESDTEVYIQPQFIPEDAIRRYEAGDVIVYAGRLTSEDSSGQVKSQAVTVKRSFLTGSSTATHEGVLTARSVLMLAESGEERIVETEIWQDDEGEIVDISDEYGNGYLTSSTNKAGLLSIPVPLVNHDEMVIDFYTLFGGHTSGPITQGTRRISVLGEEVLDTALGELGTYELRQEDIYEYLSSYADYKRGSRIEVDRQLWISPAKGLVKLLETRSEYSNNGVMVSQTKLSLKAVRTNF